MNAQRGSFALGVVVGLLVGLSVALGVALYVTKAPVPFVNKVPQRTPEQDQAEAQRNRNWDPNAPLAGRSNKPLPAASAGQGASGASGGSLFPPPVAGAGPATPASDPGPARGARDPAAILAGAPMAAPAAPPAAPGARTSDPFVYFVQAGAYTRAEEAEQQRAKLAMLGLSAKVTEREQHGRVVYRVRVGPYEARQDADAQYTKLQTSGITAQLVRVERP